MTRRIVLRVSLGPEHDAEEIQMVLSAEISHAAAEMVALRTSPPPAIRLHEDRHELRFTVTCTIGRMIDAEHTHRELAKRLRARLRAIGLDTRRVVIEYGLAWQEPATSAATGEDV